MSANVLVTLPADLFSAFPATSSFWTGISSMFPKPRRKKLPQKKWITSNRIYNAVVISSCSHEYYSFGRHFLQWKNFRGGEKIRHLLLATHLEWEHCLEPIAKPRPPFPLRASKYDEAMTIDWWWIWIYFNLFSFWDWFLSGLFLIFPGDTLN